MPIGKRYLCGSSVKFCHIAQGDADIYPRLSPTREWDIAAGYAILLAAGGAVTAPDGGNFDSDDLSGAISRSRLSSPGAIRR